MRIEQNENFFINKLKLLVALTNETNLPEEDNEDPRSMLAVLMLVANLYQEDHQSSGQGSEPNPLEYLVHVC